MILPYFCLIMADAATSLDTLNTDVKSRSISFINSSSLISSAILPIPHPALLIRISILENLFTAVFTADLICSVFTMSQVSGSASIEYFLFNVSASSSIRFVRLASNTIFAP